MADLIGARLKQSEYARIERLRSNGNQIIEGCPEGQVSQLSAGAPVKSLVNAH